MHNFFVNNNMGAISLLSPNVHALGLLSFIPHLFPKSFWSSLQRYIKQNRIRKSKSGKREKKEELKDKVKNEIRI